MPTTLAITDFDRTLFSPDFYQAFIEAAINGGLLAPDATASIQAAINDPNKTIDLLAALGEHGVDIEAAIRLARATLAPNQFLYPDALGFLDRASAAATVMIMTTATGRYWQSIKLSMCPALANFHQITLSGNKGVHIKANLQRRAGRLGLRDLPNQWFDSIMLVDDRVDALMPLIGQSDFTLWHVERPLAKYQRERDYVGIRHVSSLNEVQFP